MADNIKVSFEGEIGDILKAFKRIEGKLDTLVKNADKSTKAISKDFTTMATKIDASLNKLAKSTTKSMGTATAGMQKLGMATRQTARIMSKQAVTANLLKMADGFSGLQRQGVLALAELNVSGIRFGQTMSRVAGLVVRRFGSIALSFATIGAGVFTGKAVAGAIQFEKALANVGTILADGAPALEEFRQATLGLATATSKDLVDLTEGLYDAISAGIPQTLAAGGAMDFLKNAALAAQTGIAETKDAVKAGTVVINTFGRSAGDNTQIFDKLFEAVRLGVFRFDELATSLGKGAGIAKTANLTFDEYLSTMTAISTKGRTASQSVTALRQLIISIATPTSTATKIAKKYGFELGQNAIRAKGFKKVLENMTRGIGQNVGALKKVLRRVEGLTGAAALGADDLKRFALTFDSITDASGRLAEAAKFQEETVTVQFAKMRNQFSAIMAEVVQEAMPALVRGFKDIREAMSEMNQVSLRSGFKVFSESLTDLVRLLWSLRSSFVLLFKVILFGKAIAFFKGIVGSMTAAIGAAVLRTEQWTASLAKNTTATTVNTVVQKNHAVAMVNSIKAAGVATVSQDNLSRSFFNNIKASGLATVGVVANTAKLGFMALAAKGATFALGALNKALSLLGILTGIGAIIFVLVEMVSLLWAAGEAAAALWHSWSGGAAKAREATDKVRRVVEVTTLRTRELVAEIKKFGRAFVNSPFFKLPSAPGQLTFGAGIFTDAVIKEVTKNGKKVLEIDAEVAAFAIGNRRAMADSLIAENEKRKILKQGELESIKEINAAREKSFGVSGGLVPKDTRQQERNRKADLATEVRLKKEIIDLDGEGRALVNKKAEIQGVLTGIFKAELKAKQEEKRLSTFADSGKDGAKRFAKDLTTPLLERERIKSARNEIATITRRIQVLNTEAKARENLADKAGLLEFAEKLIVERAAKRRGLAAAELKQQLGNISRVAERERDSINKSTEREKAFIKLGLTLAEQKEVKLAELAKRNTDIKAEIVSQQALKLRAIDDQRTKELKVSGETRLKDFKDILETQKKLVSKGLTFDITTNSKAASALEGILSGPIESFLSDGLPGAITAIMTAFEDAFAQSAIGDIVAGILNKKPKQALLGAAKLFGLRLSNVLRGGISFLQGLFTNFLTSNFSNFINMAGSNEVLDISEGVNTSREAIAETAGNVAHGDRLGSSGSNALRGLVKEQKKAANEERKKIAALEEEKEASQFDNQIKAEFAKAEAFINGLVENLPILFDILPDLMDRLLVLFVNNLPKITKAFVDGMPIIIQKIIRALPVLYNAVIGQIPAIMNGIVDMLPMVFEEIANAVPHIIFNIVKHIPAMVDAFIRFVIQGIPRILYAFLAGLLEGLKDVMKEILKLIPGAEPLIEGIDKISSAINKIGGFLDDTWGSKDGDGGEDSGDREGGGQQGINEPGGAGAEQPGTFGTGGRLGAVGGLKPGVIPNLDLERRDPVRQFVNTGQRIMETIYGAITGFVANQQGSLIDSAKDALHVGSASIPQLQPSSGGNVSVTFNARGGSSAVVQKAFAEMFVAEVRKDGVAVRRPSEVARSGPTNFPRTNKVVTE